MEIGLRTGVLALIIDLAGAGIAALLLSLALRKRPAVAADGIAAVVFSCITFWYAADALSLFRFVSLASAGLELESRATRIAGVIAASCVLHVTTIWAGMRPIRGVVLYPCAVAVILLPGTVLLPVWTGVTVGGSALLNLWIAARGTAPYRASFHACLGTTLALVIPAAWWGNPVLLEGMLLLPLVCTIAFVRHSNAMDFVAERRLVFVFTLAVISAAYLFFVRFIVAEYLATEFGAFAAIAEFAMICAAGVFWLPLYEGMTRFLSRRAQAYLEAAKHVIDSADEILETNARVRFLASESASRLKIHRVCVAVTEAPEIQGSSDTREVDAAVVRTLGERAPAIRADYLHVRRTPDPAIRALLQKSGFNYAFPLRFKDRITGLVLVDTSPRAAFDEEEASVMVALSHDIAHSIASCRTVEEQMRLSRTLLQQEHLAALGRVAATIAHEVRNPLSSIKSLAQLMGEDADVQAKYSRDIGFIVAETDRLASSVGQLLAFSRPAAAPKPDASVHELLESTVAALGRSPAAAEVTIRKDLDSQLRGCLVDRESVQHIVFNLMLNALQACGPGGTVELSARLRGTDTCVIEVRDDGPGIPADARAHIFEPFFTTRKQGSGLGLAVVKKTVANMSGTIDIVSPVLNGRGTMFRVEIPLVRAFEVSA